MPKRKTHEEFTRQIYDLVGNEYTVLSEYVNYSTRFEVRHNTCGYVYRVFPSGFIGDGTRCQKCFGDQSPKALKSHERYVQEVFDLVGNEYTVMSKYAGNRNKVKFKHNTCKHVYDVRACNFLYGIRCPICRQKEAHDKQKKTHERFVEEVSELVGTEYTVLSKYEGNEKNLKIQHSICGHIYDVRPGNFLTGTRCPNCCTTKNFEHSEFIKRLPIYYLDEYVFLSEYQRNHLPLIIRHKGCDKEFEAFAFSILKGKKCPHCYQKSNGQMTIIKILESMQINFKQEVRFNDCRLERTLPFDFAIVDNNKISLLIEYDGEQHFKPVKLYGGEEGFKKMQTRDRIKNEYCKKNNIPLLRIPYTMNDDEIRLIIGNKLKELGRLTSSYYE